MLKNKNICRCDEKKRIENREQWKKKDFGKKKPLKDSDLFEMKSNKNKKLKDNNGKRKRNRKRFKSTQRKKKENLLRKKPKEMY